MQQSARNAVRGQQKTFNTFSSTWGPSQPVRAPGAPHTPKHSISGAAAQAAPLQRAFVRPRHCCCLAAVPTPGAPADPQQLPAAPLWSEEDIFDAFDLTDVPSASSSSSDDALANPEQLPVVLAAGGGPQELPPEPQQQQQPLTVVPLHSRHQRRFSQQLGAAVQQQQKQPQQHTQPSGLQQLQPLVRSFGHVHLLHRIASTHSWTAAAAVLQEEHSSVQADHVALLWSQLLPKLQAQQRAAADRARREGPAQQQHSDGQPQRLQQQVQLQLGVLQELVSLTGRFACSLAPQSLQSALQGLAAAAAAGKVVAAAAAAGEEGVAAAAHTQVVQLDRQVLQALQQQLVQVAGSCSPQELVTCLTSGQQLGWCDQQHPSAGTSSSTQGPCQCCWSVLQEASKGQLGVLLQSGGLTSFAAAYLLHGLAGCAHAAAGAGAVLTAQPASLPAQQQVPDATAFGGTDSGLVRQLVHRAFLVATRAEPVGVVSDAALGAAVCSLQAAALLQHMPDADSLEQLLAELQPHLAAGRLGAQQQLAVLQSCHELGVEPWPEWLQDCYGNLADGLQDLQPQQLLQLLHVLQAVTNLQPSHVLLHQVAKMTAVHCSRYSCQQLAGLPSALQQLGFRPQPYWLRDYLAASAALLTADPQKQQEPQQVSGMASAAVLAQMLSGVGWLSAAPPPRAWLQAVEQALLHAAAAEAAKQQQHHGQRVAAQSQQQQQQQQQQHHGQRVAAQSQQQQQQQHHGQRVAAQSQQQQQQHSRSSSRQHGQSSGRLPAACAAVVARVLGQWGYTPGRQLQQVLSASLQDPHSTGPGGGAGDGDSNPHAPAATAAAVDLSQQLQVPGGAAPVEHHTMHHQPHEPAPRPDSVAAAGRWELKQLMDLEQDIGQMQDNRGAIPSDGQLARLASGSQGRSKPGVRNRLWYRSKLLQLVKGQQQHSSSRDAPALAVL